MKVLLTHRPGGAYGYISDAWQNALRDMFSAGISDITFEAERWDGSAAMWEQFQPDLYIGCSGHRQPIPEKHSAKIAIHVNPFGPVDVGDINEPKEAMEWTRRQKPHCVFGYGFESDRVLWSYWTSKYGIPWVPMATAADVTMFDRDPNEAAKQYDVVYLGGRWTYKAKSIDKYLLPALDHAGLKFKLYGWGDWPDGYNSGAMADDQVADFLSSGRVGPCLSEPHTHRYGFDVPERVFKVIASGTLAVHDPVPALRQQIPSLQISTDPASFDELCWRWSRPEVAAERLQITRQQRLEVLSAHTYFHRLAGMFQTLGFTREAQALLTRAQHYIDTAAKP